MSEQDATGNAPELTPRQLARGRTTRIKLLEQAIVYDMSRIAAEHLDLDRSLGSLARHMEELQRLREEEKNGKRKRG